MPACRALTIEECETMYHSFTGRHKLRNQCMHLLCLTTGLRIHEALALRIRDVVKNGQVVRVLQVQRRYMKQAARGRNIALPLQTRESIMRQVQWLHEHGLYGPDQWLFKSQYGDKAISRREAWGIFHRTAHKAGLPKDLGTLGTHSWRKTFATQIFYAAVNRLREGESVDPMLEVTRALNHADPKNTAKYIPISMDSALKNMHALEALHSYAL
ncbi:MAG: tyrosine-type recombinase/integrase [Desulfovibrio sp.]|nr:tyrosine-type recombinase/integrase [Desulfovibrio sp.]